MQRSAPSLASVLKNLKFCTGVLNIDRLDVFEVCQIVMSAITLNLIVFAKCFDNSFVVGCIDD